MLTNISVGLACAFESGADLGLAEGAVMGEMGEGEGGVLQGLIARAWAAWATSMR